MLLLLLLLLGGKLGNNTGEQAEASFVQCRRRETPPIESVKNVVVQNFKPLPGFIFA